MSHQLLRNACRRILSHRLNGRCSEQLQHERRVLENRIG
jgi:hypothetical protein